MEVQEKTESLLFEAVIAKKTPQIVGGKGIYVDIISEGVKHEKILDACTGAAVGALGWGDEEVYDMVNKSIREHTYSFPFFVGNPHAERLADFYISNSPPGVFSSAMWCGSGSESNENALRIIRQYQLERGKPEKLKIISRMQSYHGFTLGAMSISAGNRSEIFKDIMIDQENICLKMPVCYPYRYQRNDETEEQYSQRLLNSLEKIIVDNNPATVSAVVVETLPGSSLGTVTPPKGYLSGIRALCNKYDVIFMLDEVMCGTGRCNPNGKLNCWENFLTAEEAPDIQTVGKTLGSGYVTIAGVLVGPKIKNAYTNGSGMIFGSHTYASHGFNCSTALKIQKKIQRENLTSNIFQMGNLMGKTLRKTLVEEDNTIVGDVRGIGGFWSLEFIQDRLTKKPFPPEANVAKNFQKICFENKMNIMSMPGIIGDGTGDIALLSPSFIITESDVHEIISRICKCVKLITEKLQKEGYV